MRHIYIGLFVSAILFIKYCLNYQKPFVHKMVNNIQNTNNIKLHELLPEFHTKQNNIKYVLADKQELRCESCKNIIDINYIDHYKLSYRLPLQMGGVNDVTNLSLICPSCYRRFI